MWIFATKDVGEVIEYVARKYGQDHVSQIITFGTMSARSVIRDVGRVLDVPYNEVDKLAKMTVFAFSRRGMDVARQVMETPAQWRAFAPTRMAEGEFAPIHPPLADFVGPVFRWTEVMIFVSSCGIAVRAIAPHVRDKTADPAVVAIDETARFVVSLLSGHIGGANRWASELAAHLEALPVVTTATDVNGRFAVDAWAAEQGLHLGSRVAAKAVSAAILEGPVPLRSEIGRASCRERVF